MTWLNTEMQIFRKTTRTHADETCWCFYQSRKTNEQLKLAIQHARCCPCPCAVQGNSEEKLAVDQSSRLFVQMILHTPQGSKPFRYSPARPLLKPYSSSPLSKNYGSERRNLFKRIVVFQNPPMQPAFVQTCAWFPYAKGTTFPRALE